MSEYKTLSEARTALQARAVLLKTQVADAGKYQYHYANIADLLEATRDLRAECGLDLSDRLLPESLAMAIVLGIRLDAIPASSPTVMLLTIRHVASGEAEHSIEPIPPGLWGRAQELGSYLTFHRRYGYLGLLGLAAEDDDGKSAQLAAERSEQPKPTTTRKTFQPADLPAILAGLGAATTIDHVSRWCKHARKWTGEHPDDERAIGDAVRQAQARVGRTLRPTGDLHDALASGDRARMDAALAAAGIVDRGEQGCYIAWAAEMSDVLPAAWAAAVKSAPDHVALDRLRGETRQWSTERKRRAQALIQEAEHRLASKGVSRG